MADQGAPTQSGPVAAPAPAHQPKKNGHGQTEAEFWADEAAPAIGGPFGIPNGMMAAAAAAPPGTPNDVGSMLGRLDARRARGLALQLQRTMGNAYLGTMLAARQGAGRGIGHGHANGNGNGNGNGQLNGNGQANGNGHLNGLAHVIQRQPPAATVAPPAGSPGAKLISPEEQEKLDKDQREFDILSKTRGSADIQLESPQMVAQGLKEKKVEAFTIQSLLARSTEPDQRRGWDAEGPATAFVIAMGGGQGGAVFQSEGMYFAAIGSGAPSLTRDKVFRVDVRGPITRVIGIDGFTWKPADVYEPNASRGEKSLDTDAKGMASTATAADLARIAGIQRPEDKNNPDSASVRPTEIPEAQVRTFLRQYIVARAVEILDANADHARKEMEEFRGAKPGSPASTTIPPAAKKKIDKAREIGKKFSNLLERERYLEELEAKVGRGQTTGGGSQMLVTVEGRKLKVETWKKRIAAARQILASGKAQILSENPLIAQLVDPRIGREEWGMQVRALVGAVNPSGVKGWDHLTGTDNTFQHSELAKKSSPESDQKAREDYVKKLDDVLKAIGEVKAKVLAGDERYLFSLPGLGQRVRGELKSIGGKNAKLGTQLEKIVDELGMSAGDIAASVVQIAGLVLQLAGFFFPPLLFIGAVMSYGATVYNMDKAVEKLTVSQAAVTPDEAMVDPVEAQSAMIDHTLQLAMDAITVGMEVGSALEAMEAGRTKDLEKLAGKGGEAKPKEIGEPKPGEPPKAADPVADPLGKGSGGGANAVDPAMTTKTGLAGPEALRKYTEGMSQVAEKWAGAATMGERAALLEGRAAAAGAEAGIPHKISVAPDPKLTGLTMKFDRATMTVRVSEDILKNPTANMAEVGKRVYHETRHGEQTWLMARMRATAGDSPAAIAEKMNIPPALAEKAVANPLAKGSSEYTAAESWFESMFGKGAKDRHELVKEGGLLDQAEAKTVKSKGEYDRIKKDPAAKASDVDAAKKEWINDWAKYEELDQKYMALPEEQDAFLIESRAGKNLDLINPEKAPASIPTGPPSGMGT